jgi:DNA modification methylase
VPFEINKTELVWPGKYDEEGNLVQPPRVSLPFQVIERVNETRATREAKKAEGLTLFDVWDGSKEGSSFEDGWRNKLIWGDNALVMSSLLANFAGKVKLVYIDPPFDVGADFSVEIEVGDSEVLKEASILEEVAYRDTWGRGQDSYLSTMRERISLAHQLIADDGFLLLHCDWRATATLRLVGDEIFGPDNYRNEIVWSYRTGGAGRGTTLPRKHDSIHVWAKSISAQLNSQSERQYLQKAFMGSKIDSAGRHYVDTILRDVLEGALTIVEGENKVTEFSVRPVLNLSSERTGYPTQKPLGLLRLLIRIFSNQNDLVADLFVGSGTTAEAAETHGRRWIACDLGRFAIHTTRKRLLEIDKCKPFEVLNLGSYERQFWSTSNFGQDLDGDGKVNLLEYIAFILKLYGGEPLAGSAHLHGRKGDAYVYIGAVSNPVTIGEIEQAVNECKKMKGTAVHVLGWEWEMGLHDPIVGEAKKLGVKLTLKQIPREVMEAEAVRKGQIKFFDLAYLEVDLQQKSNGEVVCTLSDFSTPNSDLIPDEVRQNITKWSDYVDYWAVDWDFQNDTFNHGFVTYRTRQDRSLSLKSDSHTYPKAGTYKVMIKVIDIFGNDTSKLVELKVKG